MSTAGTYYCADCGAMQPGFHAPGCTRRQPGVWSTEPQLVDARSTDERIAAAMERIADALELAAKRREQK